MKKKRAGILLLSVYFFCGRDRKMKRNGVLGMIRLSAVLLIVLTAALVTGFADSDAKGEQIQQLEMLLTRRVSIMQRFMFDEKEDAGELFLLLSEFENYPLLAEDYRAATQALDSDYDRIINMKLVEADCLEHRAACGLYYVTIRWYLSGCDGYSSETGYYRVRTDIVNNRERLADIQIIDEG